MKKGDLAAPIIMWMAVLSVSFIILPWFVENIRPLSGEAQQVEFDVRQVTSYVDTACGSSKYVAGYNPRVNEGFIRFNSSGFCIEAYDRTSCGDLSCGVLEPVNASLDEIIEIRFNKTSEGLRIGFEEFTR